MVSVLRAMNGVMLGTGPGHPPPPDAEELTGGVRRSTPDRKRHSARYRALRQVGLAAAAAVAIALVGVSAGVLLRRGQLPHTTRLPAETSPTVTLVHTSNDFDERELRRLSVNLDIGQVVPPGMTSKLATPLGQQLAAQLGVRPVSTNSAPDASSPASAAGVDPATEEAVGSCLPGLLEGATSPRVPVYVEIARFAGEPAIVYALVTEDPSSGTYERVEVWAVAHSDCRVLAFTQQDR